MTDLVASAMGAFPPSCQVSRCNKDGCSLGTSGAPPNRVVIDFDCEAIAAPGSTRCDYLVVASDDDAVYVAPIELKSGRFKGADVAKQIQAGADIADRHLPPGGGFRFAPTLARGRGVHPQERKQLRRMKVVMRGKRQQVIEVRCGAPLMDALRQFQSA